MTHQQVIKATVGIIVAVNPTTIVGPNDSRTVRWDYYVTFDGQRIDSSCNGKYATEAAARRAGRKEAKDWAAFVLRAALEKVGA